MRAPRPAGHRHRRRRVVLRGRPRRLARPTSAPRTAARSSGTRRRSPRTLEILGYPEVTLTLAVDKPRRPRLRAALRRGARRRLQARHAAAAQPHPPRRPRAPRAARAGPALRRHRAARLRSRTPSAAGHRLRVAVSTDYWPWVWPSPEAGHADRVHRRREQARPAGAPAARRGRRPRRAFGAAEAHRRHRRRDARSSPVRGGRRMVWDVDTNMRRLRVPLGRRRPLPPAALGHRHRGPRHYHYRITEGRPALGAQRGWSPTATSCAARRSTSTSRPTASCAPTRPTSSSPAPSASPTTARGLRPTWEKTIPRDLG